MARASEQLTFKGGTEVDVAAGGGVDAVVADAAVVVLVEEVVHPADEADGRTRNAPLGGEVGDGVSGDRASWRVAVVGKTGGGEGGGERDFERGSPGINNAGAKDVVGGVLGSAVAIGPGAESGVEQESVDVEAEPGGLGRKNSAATGSGRTGAAGEHVVGDAELGPTVDGASDVDQSREPAG